MPRGWLLGFLLAALTTGVLSAGEPQWIWTAESAATKADKGEAIFRRSFTLDKVGAAILQVSADNRFELWVNGERIGAGDSWQKRYQVDLAKWLVPGDNAIALRAANDAEGPAGLAAKLVLTAPGTKQPIIISTDKQWRFSRAPNGVWHKAEYNDSAWTAAVELGPYGQTPPWGAAGEIVALATEATAATVVASGSANREPGLFQLRAGDRVTLLGGAFVERMNAYGYFESAWQASFPRTPFAVRNLGWSGDTVWGDARAVFGSRADGFKRLVADALATKPTVLLLCYGENEAHAGEARLADFARGYEELIAALEPSGARLVLVAPRRHESLGGKLPSADDYNQQLAKYRDTIATVAARRGCAFIDLGTAAWQPKPSVENRLTENGVHLTGSGEWKIAAELIRRLGGRPPEWSVDLNLAGNSMEAVGTAVSEVVREGHDVRFQAHDATLPLAPLSREFSPAAVTTTMPQRLRVRGLTPGNYEIRLRGVVVRKCTDEELARGIEFADPVATEQAEAVRRLVNKKNELYLHRYSPQNETYLFLFRKHEQGNNAAELPKFEPLVEELDQEIEKAKAPLNYAVEIKLTGT